MLKPLICPSLSHLVDCMVSTICRSEIFNFKCTVFQLLWRKYWADQTPDLINRTSFIIFVNICPILYCIVTLYQFYCDFVILYFFYLLFTKSDASQLLHHLSIARCHSGPNSTSAVVNEKN